MDNYIPQYIHSINHFIGIMVLVKHLIMDCMNLDISNEKGE